MDILNEFFSSFFLWKHAMLAGAVSGAVCGFLGVYVVLRRIIFVSATLTQVSSFGVALAFYIQGLAIGTLYSTISPFALSLILTSLGALFFAFKKDFKNISQEGVIGFGFLIASAAVVIIGDKITKGAQDIADILFGTAVLVSSYDLYLIIICAILIFLIHKILFKDFIFISFDTETAKLFKYPVSLLNAVLFISIGGGYSG